MRTASEEKFAIVGLGMACSLGLDVVTACAAARAGIQRPSPLEIAVTDEETLSSVPLKGHVAASALTAGFEGTARWLQLGAAALQDLSTYAGLRPDLGDRNGFLLHLPSDFHSELFRESQLERLSDSTLRARIRLAEVEERREVRDRLLRVFFPRIIAEQPLMISESARLLTFGGPSSMLKNVTSALELIARGVIDRCIVGAIDSTVDPTSLDLLYRLGLLQTPDKPIGFFPGEAAAFVLIEGIDAARRRKARIEGHVGIPAVTAQSHDTPMGLALSTAVQQCLGNSSRTAVDHVIVNLNGDELRAKELGGAYLRLQAADITLPTSTWCPAQHFGEVRAASTAVSMCMAVRGFARHCVSGQTVLIVSTDDEVGRGAVLVKAPSDG